MSRLSEYIGRSARPSRIVELPGHEGCKVAFVLLRGEFMQRLEAQALASLREQGYRVDGELRGNYVDALQSEQLWQLLHEASRDPVKESDAAGNPYPRHLAASLEEFRTLLTVEQRDELAMMYWRFRDECAPADLDRWSTEEIMAVGQAAKKKDGERILRSFPHGTLIAYLLITHGHSRTSANSTSTSGDASPDSSSPRAAERHAQAG